MSKALTVGLIGSLAMSTSAFAHPHTAGPKDQPIANSQNHPPFVPGTGTSCDLTGEWPDSAWYGLESAHHGPDAGDPGKDDGCYITTGNVPPGQDDQNPAID
jgi:hypothetical protein